MSAANIFLFADEIVIWTDGALYEPDGTMVACTCKIGLLPHLSCAVVVRGPGLACPLLTHTLGSTFQTFDDLVSGLTSTVAREVLKHRHVFDFCTHGGRFAAIVAGWSEVSGEPEAYLVHSDRPETVEQLEAVYIAPGDAHLTALMQAEFPGATDEDLRTVEVGLRLLDLQRETRLEQVPGAGKIHGVGGFAQRTSLRRDRVDTRILHRWPDQVGEKIAARSRCIGA